MIKKQLGEMVTFTYIPIRVSEGNNKTWRKVESERTAMYIGKRTIYDGRMKWTNNRDDPAFDYEYFQPQGHFTVWLVVKNDRTKPFYVYPLGDE